MTESQQGEPPITTTEIIAISGGIGTGIGTSMAIESGAITAAMLGAAGTGYGIGVGSALTAGYKIGSILHGIDAVRETVQSMVDFFFNDNAPLNNLMALSLASIPDLDSWRFHLGTDEDMTWYVYEPGDAAMNVLDDYFRSDRPDPEPYPSGIANINYAVTIGFAGAPGDYQFTVVFGT